MLIYVLKDNEEDMIIVHLNLPSIFPFVEIHISERYSDFAKEDATKHAVTVMHNWDA